MYRAVLALIAAAICGCAAHPLSVPGNVRIGERRALPPAPPAAAPDAPPRIVAAWFSGKDVVRGRTWAGEIVTTTNTASVEVRTSLFSIDVPRRDFGRFAFDLRVFDVPPIFVRGYVLRIIARNAAGAAAEEDLPFRIR